MNLPSDPSLQYGVDTEPAAYAPLADTRPVYWSVRRELWENRYLYVAPLIVAAIVLFAAFVMTVTRAHRMRTQSPAVPQTSIVHPLRIAPPPIMFTTMIVGLFYCLDALHGERRDRSLLFWKSLPVSDRTAVLSKAGIPLVLMPVLAFLLSMVTQLVLRFLGTVVMLGYGLNPARFWSGAGFFEGLVIMFYGLTVHALWYAPIHGWLLLLSGWARRAVFLWAVLPLLAISAVERIVFNTTGFLSLLQYRFQGAMTEAFIVGQGPTGNIERLAQLTPGKFLTRPGLWLGLLFAAACIAAAVRLRRLREPV
jgi:ABC-2 type transport system permease protein